MLDKIEENRFDLWNDDLEDTFQCIITEDIRDDDYWEEFGMNSQFPNPNIPQEDVLNTTQKVPGKRVLEYNGWMEDLEKLI